MTAKLLTALKQKIARYTLVPAGGGCFELTVDGELLYSKLATKAFPNEDDLLEAVAARVKRR
ncbi:MAG: Rdx family protein [Gemmataceae bacterium]|nr:Rdx family protein [Gemmataceae bacterium]